MNFQSSYKVWCWLRIVLMSVMFYILLGLVISTFVGAFKEIYLLCFVFLGALHGIYGAEKIRRGIGLKKYSKKVANIYTSE